MTFNSTDLDHDVVAGSSFLSFVHPALDHVVAHLHHVLHTQRDKLVSRRLQSWDLLRQTQHVVTSEETNAELETLGTLSTIACFMYLSMACSMVVCRVEYIKEEVNEQKLTLPQRDG